MQTEPGSAAAAMWVDLGFWPILFPARSYVFTAALFFLRARLGCAGCGRRRHIRAVTMFAVREVRRLRSQRENFGWALAGAGTGCGHP